MSLAQSNRPDQWLQNAAANAMSALLALLDPELDARPFFWIDLRQQLPTGLPLLLGRLRHRRAFCRWLGAGAARDGAHRQHRHRGAIASISLKIRLTVSFTIGKKRAPPTTK